ncbi:MAG: LysM peptidoglycan-binding domain-containing protein, partial [Gammaproteobacteria bacterium]
MRKAYLLFMSMGIFLGACSTTTPRNDQAVAVDNTPTTSSTTDFAALHKHHDTAAATVSTDSAKDIGQAESPDVWERIRLNLSINRHLDRPSTQSKLKYYAGKQEFLNRVADRATPYIYYIVEELERRQMPLDLALLPIVESAYQPFAHSRSRASGIWQFIPSTGKRYGLKQNWWYDGRRDIVSATDAALTYLQELHDQFNGDWLLALAAYNAGELNIARAMEKNLKAGKPVDFWSLKLKNETLGYVPSLLAVAEIVSDPAKYNITLKPIPNQPYFAVIDAGSQIDLATVAQLSGMSMEEISILNPGINKWATDPDGPHHLLIPLERAESFNQKLAVLPEEDRTKWRTHVVNKGDTLGYIAGLYHTDINTLKQVNHLKSNRLHTGHTLLIPAATQPLHQYTLSQDARIVSNLKRSGDGQQLTYTVKSGDTLWDISSSYGVSVEQLCDWNGIDPDSTLRPGQNLVVWSRAGMVPAVAEVTTPSHQEHISYTVKEGDSLWLIARRYGVSVKQLRQWNGLNNASLKP